MGYIPGLDGIRAIAVMGVLLYHADLDFIPGGFLGVDVFFVLSGFLITSLLLEQYQRSGRINFKVFYLGFRLLFRAATGTVIRNGNFAAFGGWLLQEVIHHPHFDQCYSSSFISLPLPVAGVPLARGKRYAGRSRMGYMGLFTHGVRMLMPFSERIATRGIVASGALTGAGLAWLAAAAWLGASIALPAFVVLYATLCLGISLVLFATFSQSKARSLRGLTPIGTAPRPVHEPPSAAGR